MSSIDIRNLNIYSLNKKALKQITNYSEIDPKNFIKHSGNNKFNKFDLKKIIKQIKNRHTDNRPELMCLYEYINSNYIKANNHN